MTAVGKFNRLVVQASRYLIGLLLLGVTGVLFLNILLRYFFTYSFTWVEEVARFSFVWMVFLGAGLLAREGGHISLEVFFNMLPPRYKRLGLVLINCVSALMVAYIFRLSVRLVTEVARFGQKSPAALIPMWLIYAAIPIGCGLMILGFIEATAKVWRGFKEPVAAPMAEV
jgi:C4-dicarboxylate transporter, DctQ subunit